MWFGGTTLLAMLTGQVPTWIHTDGAVLAFIVGWAVMFLTPGDACTSCRFWASCEAFISPVVVPCSCSLPHV